MASVRERYLGICNFERINKVFPIMFFYWNDTYKRWINEGMPISFDNAAKEANDYCIGNSNRYEVLNTSGLQLGLGKNYNPPCATRVEPPFDIKIIEGNETHIIMVDYDGRIVKRKKMIMNQCHSTWNIQLKIRKVGMHIKKD